MACVMRSTYLSFRSSCFLPLLRKSVRRVLFVFFFCVLWFVSPPSCFFFLAASSITYLSALRFPYREGVEGGFVFFFFFNILVVPCAASCCRPGM